MYMDLDTYRYRSVTVEEMGWFARCKTNPSADTFSFALQKYTQDGPMIAENVAPLERSWLRIPTEQ
jgi:hypothetical protein